MISKVVVVLQKLQGYWLNEAVLSLVPCRDCTREWFRRITVSLNLSLSLRNQKQMQSHHGLKTVAKLLLVPKYSALPLTVRIVCVRFLPSNA